MTGLGKDRETSFYTQYLLYAISSCVVQELWHVIWSVSVPGGNERYLSAYWIFSILHPLSMRSLNSEHILIILPARSPCGKQPAMINQLLYSINTPSPIHRGTGYCFRSISLYLSFFLFFKSLFLCYQDYEKTAEPICMKFLEKVRSDRGTTWFNFGPNRRNRAMPRR